MIASYMIEFSDLRNMVCRITTKILLKKILTPNRLPPTGFVNVAIEEDARFKSCDIEFKLPQPSYTITTLTYLKEKYPQKEFSLIMGTDNLESIDKWKNYEQILENYSIYTYPRPASDGGKFKEHPKVKLITAPLLEITSSFIRASIKGKKI